MALLVVFASAWLLEPRAHAQGSLVVTITAPASGATVSGSTPVSASVSVIGGLIVQGVQFKLDGANLGAEDTAAPYSIPWNTTATSNGSHTLTAVARVLFLPLVTSDPVTVTVSNDTTPPTVTINQAAGQSDPTSTSPINFTAVFSEPVSGFTSADVTITGTAGGSKTATISGGPSTYTVAVSGMTTDGSVVVAIPAGVATDAASNANTASTSTDNTVGWVAPDTTAPTVTINQAVGQSDPTSTSPINFTAVFSEPVSGFTSADVAITGTAGGTKTVVISGGPSIYTVAVSGMTTDGTVVAAIPAGVVTDAASNANTASTSTDNTVSWVAPDTTAPTVTINQAATQNDPTTAAPISFTAVFSEPVTGFTSADVTITGTADGTKAVTISGGPSTYTVAVSGMTTEGTVVAAIPAGVATDAASNANTASTSTDNSVTFASQETTTRVEDSNAAIVYTPAASWILGYSDPRPWSGGTAALGFGIGHATLNFTGTGVSWIGFRGPQTGIARVHLDGTLVATVDAYSPTEVMHAVLYTVSGLPNASHQIAIEVTRTKNEASSDFYVIIDAFDVTATGPVDTTPPSVTLTSPTEGATLSGTATLAATASDNVGVAQVQFYVDGNPFGDADTVAPYAIAWNTATVSEGAHHIMAQARDAAGNTSLSDIVHVTVSHTDSTPPAVAVSSPSGGATVFGTVTVTASASDNVTVAGVQFFVDGAPLGAEDTSAPYSAGWDTTSATNGSHALTARARDGAGNTTLSSAVTVSVANGAGGTVRLEDGNTAIAYAGAWNLGNGSRPWSGGTAAVGFALGQSADVTFNGTGITWIGFQGSWAGIANVYVDGVFAAAIDGYAPAEAVQVPVFTVGGLALGPHTLTIEVTRTKNAASTDFVVIVDAFDIIGAPPDATAPTVSVTAPLSGATVFGTVPFKASADDNTGVASVTFFVDGVQLGQPDALSPYTINWNTTTVTDGPHTLTAVARDAAGNQATSAPVAVTVANAAPPALATATRIENTNLAIAYLDGCTNCGQAPSWFHGSRSRTWSDGTASFMRAAGGRATLTFTGTAVKWVGFRAAWAGIARVFVDGVFVSQIDLFSPTEEVQVPVFQVSDLTPGTHTIAVEATGQQNPEATDNAVVVDAFDVSPGLPPPVNGTRSEESASSVTLTSGWNSTDTTQAWSGGTAAVASGAGERATFVFTGTAVNWVGKRGPDMGIARVYLDGAFQAQVDSYFPVTIQGLTYSVAGLAPGEHRLEIEVTGLKHDQASSHALVVDAFDVRSRLEEGEGEVAYSLAWTLNDTVRNWSGTSLTAGAGTASYASMAGAHADLTFTGTAVTWIGLRAPTVGIADVYLDGVFAQQIDLYSATEQVQAPIFTASGLAPGTHTLRVEATGTKNPAASTTRVHVDAFDVTLSTPAPPYSRVQEANAAVAYSASWINTGASGLWSGGQAKESRIVGAQATFTFSGTSVRWISERGLGTGVARVLIDGQFVALVDTNTPFQEEYQEAVFTATGLAPGTHTLTIEIVGRNNETPGTTVEPVILDAFDIHQQ